MLKASKYEASHKIRFLRVVVDYDVDRMQVYRQRCPFHTETPDHYALVSYLIDL